MLFYCRVISTHPFLQEATANASSLKMAQHDNKQYIFFIYAFYVGVFFFLMTRIVEVLSAENESFIHKDILHINTGSGEGLPGFHLSP